MWHPENRFVIRIQIFYRCSNRFSSLTTVEHRMGKSLQTSKRVDLCGIKDTLYLKNLLTYIPFVYRYSEKRKNVERRV